MTVNRTDFTFSTKLENGNLSNINLLTHLNECMFNIKLFTYEEQIKTQENVQ